MFLGLRGPGKDHERFHDPEPRALFICEKTGWRYYGQYIVHRRVEADLSVDEWNAFSDEVGSTTIRRYRTLISVQPVQRWRQRLLRNDSH